MYSLSGYGEMILDSVRTNAYVRALREAVRSDSVVLDIGTGTGIFAVLAHKFGARKVIAVESDDVIQIAREIADANGCGGAIEFHQGLSTALELSEQASVIVSDLHGVLPLFQYLVPSLIDARRRLLAPGGVFIPQRDELWLSVLEDVEAYRHITSPWSDDFHDLDMSASSRRLVNQWVRNSATAAQLLVEPTHLGTLDYYSIESPDFVADVQLRATRDGIAHGLCVWFDASLADGIGFSNAPGLPHAPRMIYQNAFFPFTSPIALRAGDTFTVTLKANLISGDYLWRWDTKVWEQGDPSRIRANFKQSGLAGQLLSPSQLQKRADGYLPKLNEDGEIDKEILQLMCSGLSLGDIARQVATTHPKQFSGWQQALARVGELSLRYSL